ncbi:YiiX/YebB-like N1pC/P60 family cysteine hydrolase [Lysinibacillus sp. NPDC093692]|uniref:YiiX/YebB-like N1pC/P60 family cysteine hydrolase n=1 Tax=Lysinibacillus sp. NPDC093692 TaxID=3390578 RepID=UPI003D076B13
MGTTKFNEITQISYEEAIKEIKNGDIFFCSGRYLVSELIKKASISIFSHVGLLYYWNNDVFILESVEDDGVRAIPLFHYLENYENSNKKYNGEIYVARYKIFDKPDFDKEEINKMFESAIKLLNRNYDKAEIAKIVARIGLNVGKHQDNDEYICSEFVDVCFKQIKIEFPRDQGGFIYPEHIAKDSNIQPLFEIV